MLERFILQKRVDKSMFREGIAVPAKLHQTLSTHLSGGRLERGERRPLRFFLENVEYEVTLRNEDFDRQKNPNHVEIWQFNYRARSPIACRLREIFSSSYQLLSIGAKPLNDMLIVRSTWIKDAFHLEPLLNGASVDKQEEKFFEAEEAPRIERNTGRTDELDGDCPWTEIFIERLLL